jgi:hypothetical protein
MVKGNLDHLNEELSRMKKLMNFNIGENSHDILSESNLKKSEIDEQDKKTMRGVQNYIGLPWETVDVGGTFQVTFPQKLKLSRQELNELLEKNPDLFKKAFKDALNANLGTKGAASVSEDNINKLSEYWINKIKTDRSFNKDMRYSLWERDEKGGVLNIKIEKLKEKPQSFTEVSSKNTDIPKIKLIDTDKKSVIAEEDNVINIAKFVNDKNFSNLDGDQYYIEIIGANFEGIKQKYPYLKSIGNQKIIVSTPKESKGIPGKITGGEPNEETVDLDVDFGDLFPVAITSNTSVEDIRQRLMEQINTKIQEMVKELNTEVTLVSINTTQIIGSASNAWNGGRTWLPPTHKIGDDYGASPSSGPSRDTNRNFADWAQNVDFTVAPNGITGDNSSAQIKNANYAWQRTQDVSAAINQINKQLGGKFTAKIDSEWRITDTGGQLGVEGQFVKTKLQFNVQYQTTEPVKETPGSNRGVLYNFTYNIIPTKRAQKGNINIDLSFTSGERVGRGGKFMSQRKAIRKAKRGKRFGSGF